MPAGPIGSVWKSGSWPDTAWEVGSWANPTLPVITTMSLPDGREGVPYAQTVQATGGVLPYTWTVDSGTLPPGLMLDAGTGAITGTPTTAGLYPFVIKVTDANLASDTQPLSIRIAPPVPTSSGGNGEVVCGSLSGADTGKNPALGGYGGWVN